MKTKLNTERLQLRLLEHNDAEVIYALRSNPIVGKFIIRPLCENIETAEAFVAKTINSIKNDALIMWAIVLKAENKMIGTICFWNFSEDRKTAELGYDLLPAYHNKGIMSEAVQSVLNYGNRQLNLVTVEAFTHFENENSMKLLEKHGFIFQTDREDEGFPHNRIFVKALI